MRKAMEKLSVVARLPLQIAHIVGFFVELLHASACFFIIDRQIEKHASSDVQMHRNTEKIERREHDDRHSDERHDVEQ